MEREGSRRVREGTGLLRVFEAITRPVAISSMVARNPWKFQSRRETKSGVGLKDESVYCTNARRSVGSQWPCQAVTTVAEMKAAGGVRIADIS